MSREPSYEELEQRLKELESEAAERERLEKALDVQIQELISIFDGISEPIYVCDPGSHELLYANAAVASIFGPDIVGKKCYRVLQGLDEPCDFCTNSMIFGENLGNPYIWEFQNRLNGRWYRCIDKAIRWPDGRMVRYEIAMDIHDLKLAEEALLKANEELYNLTQQLEEKVQERTAEIVEKNKRLIAAERFAAMGKMANRIAHELRDSLTVIGGFAMRADAKTPENDPKKRYLRMIVDEVRILEKKVSDIIKI